MKPLTYIHSLSDVSKPFSLYETDNEDDEGYDYSDKDDEIDGSKDDDNNGKYDNDKEEEEGLPQLEEQDAFFLGTKSKWILPTKKDVAEIFHQNISSNHVKIKNKKRLTPIEKATLRYGASGIIDLSANMKSWFTMEERDFMLKDYKNILQIPSFPEDVEEFISSIEKVCGSSFCLIFFYFVIIFSLFYVQLVFSGNVKEAYIKSLETHLKSEENGCIFRISKIYSDL